MANGLFQVRRLLVGHLQAASQLIDQYGTTLNLRTLDAIQLAVAVDYYQNYGLDSFVCADTNLCQIAQAEGLAVINPMTPIP
jgi:hypothetical protein